MWRLEPIAKEEGYPSSLQPFYFCVESIRTLREVFKGHLLMEELLDKIVSGDDLTANEARDMGLLIAEKCLLHPAFNTYFGWRTPYLIHSGGMRSV